MYRKIIYTTRIEDAPEIRPADLMSITEAAEFLAVSVQTVDYHIKSGQLVAVIASDGEYTSYKRHRRWVIRGEVERFKIELLDDKLSGADWRTLDNGDILLWLPEIAEAAAVKSDQEELLRQITLTQKETGELEIDVAAIKDNGQCSIRVDIQSEVRYPNMQGIEVILNLPDDQRMEKTNRSGGIVFSRIKCADLPLARLTIKTPTT